VELIRELIQTIIVIVVLGVLVEMLLPSGDMRRYVKMVMGLLIIMAILQAAADVVNSDFMQEVPAVTVSETGTPPMEDIMAAGQELAGQDREKAEKQFSEGLSDQVMALVGMNGEIQALDARVSLDGDNNSDIKEITIVFNAAGESTVSHRTGTGGQSTAGTSGGNTLVQPVVVELDGESQADEPNPVKAVKPEQKQAAADLTKMVAQFYNLKPDQVKYEFQE